MKRIEITNAAVAATKTAAVAALNTAAVAAVAALAGMVPMAQADTGLTVHNHGGTVRADGHAPIGVMGDHMHRAGEFMVSYRYMFMSMEENRIGTETVTPETIVSTIANPFSPPATLRVVPTRMTMGMHMVGAMYAPTDWLTLMAMGSHQSKKMDHITFQGAAGTTRLGTFTTRSDGLGDTKVSGLVKLFEAPGHHVHLNAGLSLPTGSITADDTVLTPMGATTELRLPYPMQLGSGSYDLLPGITYSGRQGAVGWGAQYAGTVRVHENSEDYRLGDEHKLTAWASYSWADWGSTSFRVTGMTKGKISGQDGAIAAPVQTADPDNHGGHRIDLGVGANFALPFGDGKSGRLAFELGVPVYQDLNGPQFETDFHTTAGLPFSLQGPTSIKGGGFVGCWAPRV